MLMDDSLIKELETYRLEKQLTQAKLAEMLGVHLTTVNRWFKGRFKPSQLQTYQLQKFLKDEKK